MSFIPVIIVGLVSVMSMIDLYISVKGAKDGWFIEANPLWKRWFGEHRWTTITIIKVLITAFYAAVVLLAWPSIIAVTASVVGLSAYLVLMYRQWLYLSLIDSHDKFMEESENCE